MEPNTVLPDFGYNINGFGYFWTFINAEFCGIT